MFCMRGPRRKDPVPGKRSQHHCDLVGGSFKTVKVGVTPSTESDAAGLTVKGLDSLSMTMYAIPNQGVDVSVCDLGVRALLVGMGKALSAHPFRYSPPAFDLAPGTHREALALQPTRGWRRGDSWTIEWGAWLEETLDHGVQRHFSRVERAMMGLVKMTKPCHGEHE